MITRRTKIQLLDLRGDHAARRQLRRRPLRPARPARPRRQLHRGRALHRLRRHLRRRRGDLPRRRGRQGRAARAHRRRRRRPPRHRQRLRRHPGRHARRWSATGSAVGEQYVELQPKTDAGPYLERRLRDRQARTPARRSRPRSCSPTSRTPSSRSTRRRCGRPSTRSARRSPAPARTCSGSSTPATPSSRGQRQLRRHHRADPGQQHRAQHPARLGQRDPQLRQRAVRFSTALAGADPDLRRLIDNGSAAATELRDFLEDNEVELGELINNLVTTGEVVVKHLDGIEQILVIYPYVVEGGFTVVSKSPDTGLYDAHFGLILTRTAVCTRATRAPTSAPPQDGSNAPDERERPLHRARRRRATPAARRTHPRRGGAATAPRSRLLRPGRPAAHLGRRDPAPGTRPVRGPADARRGLVEVAVSPALDDAQE